MKSGRAQVLELKLKQTDQIFIAMVSFITGIAIDFLFNGVAVKVLSKQAFSEAWFFIYAPVFLTIAATYSTFISQSRWRRLTTVATAALLMGMVFGHLSLIGHRSVMKYDMTLVPGSPIVLLRSDKWPQILFIKGENVQKALLAIGAQQTIVVGVDVVTDYGCIRSTTVSTAANFDIKGDAGADWVWRLNKFASTNENDGPGMEDHVLPWCKHQPEIKMSEGGPDYWRPWDDLLLKAGSNSSTSGSRL